jgi:hypothetical protein
MATFISIPQVLALSPDGQLEPDKELRAVRVQAALVRSLLDELDEVAPPGAGEAHTGAFAAQAIEELTQLACRMIETAAAIAPQRVSELCLRRWAVLDAAV